MKKAVISHIQVIPDTFRLCACLGISRSSYYAWRKRSQGEPPVLAKRGPKTPWSDQVLAAKIREVLTSSLFTGEGHRKVWARLRHQGIQTSKRRVLRLMRENGLLSPGRVGRAHGPKAHDGTITTTTPDEMWGTDMTRTWVAEEGYVAVFIAIDHCTTECIGIHASKEGNRFEALEPIKQGVRENYDAISQNVAAGLSLRHDHGSCYMASVFQSEIKFLGIKSSPSYVREPEGNGCAERFIRTLKEQLLWLDDFRTLEELQAALQLFKHRYNNQWLIQRHGHRSPASVRESFENTLPVAA